MIDRPQFKEAGKNSNKKVQDCIDKGYLVEPKDFKGDLEAVLTSPSCFQPYSFALKDEENLLLEAMKDSPEDGEPALGPESPPVPGPPTTPCQDRQTASGADNSSSSTGKIKARPILDASAIPLPGGESVNSAQLDLPDIHMLKISDTTVDCCTKYQHKPSNAMNEQWFHGTGVLDVPIQLLPWTDRTEYAVPRIEDLPAQWLSSTARTLLGLKIAAVIVMRAMVEGEVAEVEMY
jgi:hypothetical protein